MITVVNHNVQLLLCRTSMDFADIAWSVLEVAAILQLHHTTKLLLRPCCLPQMLLTRNGTEPCIHKNFKSSHAQHMKQ